MKNKPLFAVIIFFIIALNRPPIVQAEDIGCKFCYANPGGCQNGIAFCAHSCYSWAGFVVCSANDCQGPGGDRCGGGPKPTSTPTQAPTPTPTKSLTPPTSPTPTPTTTIPTPPPPPAPPAGGSWCQTIDGDVHSENEILPQLPAGEVFSFASLDGASGVVSYGDDFDPGAGAVSTPGWLVKTSYASQRYDYSYFNANLEPDQIRNGNQNLSGLNLAGANIWKIDGDLRVDADLPAGLGAKIFLVSGQVEIQTNLADASSLGVFISSGDIVIDPTVHEIRAVLITSNRIETGSIEENETLTVQGMAIGWGDVRLERERDDQTEPAEKFVFDPEIFFQLRDLLGRPRYFWQEVVP